MKLHIMKKYSKIKDSINKFGFNITANKFSIADSVNLVVKSAV